MRILHSQRIILISKPRSGSTSLRRALDPYLRTGDVGCDQPFSVWHPHHTAEQLRRIFDTQGWPFADYWKVCTSRNPFDLVVSYYSFFKPDDQGRYNYQQQHDPDKRMPFRQWVLEGRIWDQNRLELGADLSSIGIDAFCFDSRGTRLVDMIADFPGDIRKLEREIRQRVGDRSFRIPHLNRSHRTSSDLRKLYDEDTRRAVASMFERECDMFGYTL